MNTISAGCTSHPLAFCKVHTHKWWEIILTTSGDNRSIVDGIEYTIGAGDILVIPPNTPHGANEGHEFFTDIYVAAKQLPFDGFILTHDFDDSLSHLMPLIMKQTMQGNENGELCDSLLDTICRYITKYRGTVCKHPFVVDFRNTILDNIANADFDIAAEIKKTGFNADYFRRCFTFELGMTPIRYLTMLRIVEAKRQLADSNLSITEIARQCGFSDVYYFSRRFGSIVGIPPLTYRKQRSNNKTTDIQDKL